MKLTAEVIAQAPAGPDALRDSQLDLRGLKAPAVENLGAAPDVYDALNLTDNDIRALGNFPQLRRLRTLYAANNQIARIDARLAHQLPYLTTLVLTNNNLSHLAAAAHALAKFPFLEYVSLLNNPLAAQQHYRSYLIWRCPKVRVLDFQRITDKVCRLILSLARSWVGQGPHGPRPVLVFVPCTRWRRTESTDRIFFFYLVAPGARAGQDVVRDT